MDFLILGPLSVLGPDGEIEVGGPRDKSLLAILLINAGSVVSTDRLIEDIWGDPDATAALHAAVFRLRRVLEPDRPSGAPPQLLVKRSPGYVLMVEAEKIDGHRFVRLVTEAQDPSLELANRAGLLSRALEMWQGQGPALSDFSYDEFAQAEIRKLSELRVAAQEELIDTRLQLGLHREAIADLEALVVEYPLREKLWGQLMLALYRSGRQTEALRVLQDARRVIGEDSGLEPGPHLLRLEEAILEDDPSLNVQPAEGRTATPSRSVSSSIAPPASKIIGREEDLEGLRARMADGRLATLVGPGGVGKTRLALEVAHRQGEDFPDGCYMARLERATDERGVLRAVSDALGLAGDTQADVTNLCAYLGSKKLLLILDGCEHLQQECAALAGRLQEEASSLQILATSRRRLGVSGELLWQVSPLSLPGESGLDLTGDLGSDAVALFLDRAHAVNPSLSLDDPATSAGAAAVVLQLDGLPLAIELAAAQCHTLPVREIANRLTHDLRLLSSHDPTAEARQRTMQATIDWSYSQLTTAEQALFTALSVIPDSWDIDAAEALYKTTSAEGPSALELVLSLAEQSMVMPVVDIDGVSARFRILRPLQIAGRRQLVETGRLDEAQRDHAHYIRDLFEQSWEPQTLPEVSVAARRLREELWNFNGAFEWAIDHDPETALRMAAGPGFYWRVVSVGPLVLSALQRSLATVDTRDRYRARALFATSRLSVGPREVGPKDLFDLAVAQARSRSTIRPLMDGAPTEPVQAAGEALDIFEEIGSESGIAEARIALGRAHIRRDEYAEAEQVIEQGLTDLAGTDLHLLRCWLQNALVEAKLGQSKYQEAERLAVTALANHREIRAPGVGAVLENLARIAKGTGRYEQAADYYREALDLYAEGSLHPSYYAAIRLELGLLAVRREDWPDAKRELGHSLEVAERYGYRMIYAMARNAQAQLAMSQADYPTARQYVTEAVAIQEEIGDAAGQAITLTSAGYLSNLEDDGERALVEYRQSLIRGGINPEPIALARGFEGIAVQAALHGKDERTAILIGAADTQRQRARTDRHEWHDLLGADQTTRIRLGDAEYQRAVAQGRELNSEGAIELALMDETQPSEV